MPKNNIKQQPNCKEKSESCNCTEESSQTNTDKENQEPCSYGCKDELTSDVIEDSDKSCASNTCSSCGCEEDLLEEKEQLWDRKPLLIISAAAIILSFAIYLDFTQPPSIFTVLLFLTVIIISGYDIIKKGLVEILKGQFTMNFLMTIAVFGSFLIGSGAEGAVVIFLFYIALYLENYAGEKARRSITALINLVPETATIKKDGKNVLKHVYEVEIGDIIIVKPGDKIPLDGIIINGFSSINQAAITGESELVNKGVGDEIFAGTLNEEGYIEFEVTKHSEDTVLSKIVQIVKDSQKRRSNTETFIDKFAKYYTPAVIIVAALVAILPVLIFGLSLDTWIYRALVLLIISCPCAFLLSTPVAMVSGITAGTKKGVLIKGSRYVEEMQKIKVMVFDKTGTLTMGKLEVIDILPLEGYSKNNILSIAGSLESKSKHPLAMAVTNYIEESKVEIKNATNFKSITGKGLMGKIDENQYYIGKKDLFGDEYDFPNQIIDKLEDKGKTVVLVGNDKSIMGIIGLRDKLRVKSESTISKLKNEGIKTVMLTGDNKRSAKTVSERIGMDEYFAELLPEDKVAVIEKFLIKHGAVAMVGDGINDAPALARSNVGIAMGAAGSDVAIETADIALMHDDISKINYLMDISRKTMAIVKQNITIALIIQLSLSIFAIIGFVTLWMAVTFGDMGLTLAVILNSLRIMYTK